MYCDRGWQVIVLMCSWVTSHCVGVFVGGNFHQAPQEYWCRPQHNTSSTSSLRFHELNQTRTLWIGAARVFMPPTTGAQESWWRVFMKTHEESSWRLMKSLHERESLHEESWFMKTHQKSLRQDPRLHSSKEWRRGSKVIKSLHESDASLLQSWEEAPQESSWSFMKRPMP